VLVVGAGLAGLSAAYCLRNSGSDVLVVEAEDRPGGWAKTDWSGPWGADRAIHVLYFRDPHLRAWAADLLGGDWIEHDKRCLVDSRGVRTPFPFHANLHGRPAHLVGECLVGLWQASLDRARSTEPPVTFADWIAVTGGAGVARQFMNPYNTKQWTVAPAAMGCDWMGDFLPNVDMKRAIEGALEPCDSRLGLNATFHYPRRGISSLADALAARVGDIRYGVRVVGLEPTAHRATLSDGTRVRYDQMVSTMPLTGLAALLAPLPPAQREAARRLECVDLLLVDVGFEGDQGADVHWVYFPDPDVLAYRLHAAHALSPAMAPANHGLYCLEISHSRHRPLPRGGIRRRVIDDLVRTRWLPSPDRVRFYRERRFPCSYVLPRVGFRQDADVLRAHALERDIHSIGRYGAWKYCNQEDALLDGRRVAETLMGSVHAG
jgi:UDP-galactopyranose mutase